MDDLLLDSGDTARVLALDHIAQGLRQLEVQLLFQLTVFDQIDSDVKNYENIMVNLAVYDRSQAGEAYMASFSENGVSRTWKDRESLFVGVFPFVKAM